MSLHNHSIQAIVYYLHCNTISPDLLSNVIMSDKKDPVLESIEQTKASYKRLGSSGLRVSVPIFGCMSFGSTEWQPWVIEEEQARLASRKSCHNMLTSVSHCHF